MNIDFRCLDDTWTLFIDRDGVINVEKEGDYIYNWEEFTFYPDTLSSLEFFSGVFGRIIVVTNQRGVAKGFMTLEDLRQLHGKMCEAVTLHGGRIDKIYFCTDFDDESHCRKPNTGMALEAQKDFPDIDFKKSIMLGNRQSDMQFGKRMKMKTIYLKTTHPETSLPVDLVDAAFDHLSEIVDAIKKVRTRFI